MAYKRITKPPSIKQPNTCQVIVISFIQRMLELYPASQGMVRMWSIDDYLITCAIERNNIESTMCTIIFNDDHIICRSGDGFRKYYYCDPDYEDQLVTRIKDCEIFVRGLIGDD